MLEASSVYDTMSLEELSFEMEGLDYTLEDSNAKLEYLQESILASSANVSLED